MTREEAEVVADELIAFGRKTGLAMRPPGTPDPHPKLTPDINHLLREDLIRALMVPRSGRADG